MKILLLAATICVAAAWVNQYFPQSDSIISIQTIKADGCTNTCHKVIALFVT